VNFVFHAEIFLEDFFEYISKTKLKMKRIQTFEDFSIPYEGWTSSYSSQFENEEKELHNYMFFQHLMTIRDAIDDLLQMDRAKVDQILQDGHAWAVDHITTSVDDIEEVYHFLKNRSSEIDSMDQGMDTDMTGEPEEKPQMPEIQIIGNDDNVEVEFEAGEEKEEE
jgi:hypothetical protein